MADSLMLRCSDAYIVHAIHRTFCSVFWYLAGMATSDHGQAVDRTVCDALSRAKIEDYYNFSIKDADPKALRFVVDQSKRAGNEAFRQGQYQGEGCGFTRRREYCPMIGVCCH